MKSTELCKYYQDMLDRGRPLKPLPGMGPDDNCHCLFTEISREIRVRHTPLGGVHKEIIVAYANSEADGCGTWASEDLHRWGISTSDAKKGWKRKLQRSVSLEQIRYRTDRESMVSIVSHKVKGVYRTGAANLKRVDVIAILLQQGYEPFDDEILPLQRIETFQLKSAI